MLKKFLVAAAIMMTNPAFASAQDIFWSFSPTEATSTTVLNFDNPTTGSAYIFSDGLFGFDAIDLQFTTSNSDVIRFTGGEAFNPTFDVLGGTRFNFSAYSNELTIDADGKSGGLFLVNVTGFGVNPAISQIFDPGFVAEVGPNGAVLLARIDFELVGYNYEEVDLEFVLGPLGALQLPDNILDPTFGSATLISFAPPKLGYCIGDVNLSGNFENNYADSVDFLDIPPFIALLAAGDYQFEADCNFDGVVDFRDIVPFILLLPGS